MAPPEADTSLSASPEQLRLPPKADHPGTTSVRIGPTKGRLRPPVRGFEVRVVYTEGVYIWVVGVASSASGGQHPDTFFGGQRPKSR